MKHALRASLESDNTAASLVPHLGTRHGLAPTPAHDNTPSPHAAAVRTLAAMASWLCTQTGHHYRRTLPSDRLGATSLLAGLTVKATDWHRGVDTLSLSQVAQTSAFLAQKKQVLPPERER